MEEFEERENKYDLVGIDRNPFCVMAYVRNAMRIEGFSIEERDAYSKRCISGDYYNLL